MTFSMDNPPDTIDPLDTITYSPDDPVSISKVIDLRNKGLTYAEVGKIIGVSKQAIQQRLRPFMPSIDAVKVSQDQSAALWTTVRDTSLNALTSEDFQKASMLQKVTAAGIADDKYRRAADLSTSKVTHEHILKSISELSREEEILEAEVGLIEDGE